MRVINRTLTKRFFAVALLLLMITGCNRAAKLKSERPPQPTSEEAENPPPADPTTENDSSAPRDQALTTSNNSTAGTNALPGREITKNSNQSAEQVTKAQTRPPSTNNNPPTTKSPTALSAKTPSVINRGTQEPSDHTNKKPTPKHKDAEGFLTEMFNAINDSESDIRSPHLVYPETLKELTKENWIDVATHEVQLPTQQIDFIEQQAPAFQGHIQQIQAYTSTPASEEHIDLIKDQLEKHAKGYSISAAPFNLCDSFKGLNDIDLKVFIYSQVEQIIFKTEFNFFISKNQLGDIDYFWSQPVEATTTVHQSAAAKAKLVHSRYTYATPYFPASAYLPMSSYRAKKRYSKAKAAEDKMASGFSKHLKLFLKCTDKCKSIHLVLEDSSKEDAPQALFKFRKSRYSRYQWDPAFLSSTSIGNNWVSHQIVDKNSLSPTQCEDASRGRYDAKGLFSFYKKFRNKCENLGDCIIESGLKIKENLKSK